MIGYLVLGSMLQVLVVALHVASVWCCAVCCKYLVLRCMLQVFGVVRYIASVWCWAVCCHYF
jgi:hypothetical protein